MAIWQGYLEGMVFTFWLFGWVIGAVTACGGVLAGLILIYIASSWMTHLFDRLPEWGRKIAPKDE